MIHYALITIQRLLDHEYPTEQQRKEGISGNWKETELNLQYESRYSVDQPLHRGDRERAAKSLIERHLRKLNWTISWRAYCADEKTYGDYRKNRSEGSLTLIISYQTKKECVNA